MKTLCVDVLASLDWFCEVYEKATAGGVVVSGGPDTPSCSEDRTQLSEVSCGFAGALAKERQQRHGSAA